MAFTTSVEICNLALTKIGQRKITATQLASPGTNDLALKCSGLYEPERDMLLASHPWNFALRPIEYDIDDFKDTITGTTAANPVVVTGTDISIAGVLEGLGVYLWDTGLDDLDSGIFVATTVVDTSQTFELYKKDRVTTVDGSAFGTATTGYIRLIPILEKYSYMFKLPTDCLKVYKIIDGKDNYTVEQGYLLTDNDEPQVEYIQRVTSVSQFSQGFIIALACKLASELEDDRLKKLKLLNEFEQIVLPRAQRLNAIETMPKDKGRKTDPDELTSWQKAGR